MPQILPLFEIRRAGHTRHTQSATCHARRPQRIPTPRLPPPPDFLNPTTTLLFRLKFATILGFFGMLRFSAITLLKPIAIILVAVSGRLPSLLTFGHFLKHNM